MRVFILSVIIISLFAACSPPQEPLRIVSSPWPGYEPLYLARDLGYLNSRIFNLSEMPSSNITWEAFSNGSADVATLTLDETLSLLAKGRKVKILMVMDISNGADVVVARPEIDSLSMLKGKTIGMTNIPLGLYMLSRTLEVAGLEAKDVKVLPMPEDKHEKAYKDNRIDAAITFEPFKTNIEKMGGRVIFDSSKIPNEIFDLLVVREDIYNSRKKDICLLGQQWLKTLDYIKQHPDQTATAMGRRLDVDKQQFNSMMAGLIVPDRQLNKDLLGNNLKIVTPANKLAELMYREKIISRIVDPVAAIDPEYQNCIK